MTRQQKRQLARKIKKMDHNQLYQLQVEIFKRGVNAAIEEIKKALHDEFGFGEKRISRLIDRVNKNLNETN
ncbi:hypothetical protein [Caloranaerobacter sp. DY30410]|uniref:hypothetical protein n=1 Tax=Caloranaerobacter sp. DY30410 TaxID=3238305 RepID=UPI003D074CF8